MKACIIVITFAVGLSVAVIARATSGGVAALGEAVELVVDNVGNVYAK